MCVLCTAAVYSFAGCYSVLATNLYVCMFHYYNSNNKPKKNIKKNPGCCPFFSFFLAYMSCLFCWLAPLVDTHRI